MANAQERISSPECPSCGAPLPEGGTVCAYCGRTVYITTFTSMYDLSMSELKQAAGDFDAQSLRHPDDARALFSLGCCYLRLGKYAKAEKSFQDAIDLDLDNPEAYLYHAIALLGGEPMSDIGSFTAEEIAEDVRAGLAVGTIPGLYLLWSCLQSRFYEQRGLIAQPSSAELFDKAVHVGATQADIDRLFELMDRPGGGY